MSAPSMPSIPPEKPAHTGAANGSPLHAPDQALEMADGGSVRELRAALLADRACHAGVEEGVSADDRVLVGMRRTAQLAADWILTNGQEG